MAMNGYLLILEIFLRPILTVFGLLGGLAIFSAMATILNEIFDLVVINTAGVDLQAVSDSQFSRHIVDVFFFTVVYAVLLYMMAVSSFKMITLVPNNILRWLGQSVASFSDNDKDPAQGLTQYAAIGGARIGGQLAGGLTKAGQGLGGLVDGVGKIAKG
jgi:ABC-type multidrug transport system permease subunit